MGIGVWILGDQLAVTGSALASVAVGTPVILIEALAHARVRPYHKQKLVLVWSAMRHFAQELQAQGYPVHYCEAEDFQTPLQTWITAQNITELRVMAPADKPFQAIVSSLKLTCRLQIHENNQFLWSEAEFCHWAKGRKRLLMEDFYRACRQRSDILMAAGQPLGGCWNFDPENRQPPKKSDPLFQPPTPLIFVPDAITKAVIAKVEKLQIPTYGKLTQFSWGVTRAQAQQALLDFLQQRLSLFGPYQDAMITEEFTLWHALLSPYLNLGLLHPLEVAQAAESRYWQAQQSANQLSLNSVEGFIRQIIGWREYMRGVYVFTDSDYASSNWFQHTRPLPAFFWDASQTQMNCLYQCLHQTEETGYAHHIQRLMVLSNFALIAGIQPQAVQNWFHAAYIDAYDWVMQTNVLGMGQFADGGLLASKPYAASANYINKMSDYCRNCHYDYKQRLGERACPFNYLYWNFLDRHRPKLSRQGRMSFILKNLDKMSTSELEQIRIQAAAWFP